MYMVRRSCLSFDGLVSFRLLIYQLRARFACSRYYFTYYKADKQTDKQTNNNRVLIIKILVGLRLRYPLRGNFTPYPGPKARVQVNINSRSELSYILYLYNGRSYELNGQPL